jgi:hypothetical protein
VLSAVRTSIRSADPALVPDHKTIAGFHKDNLAGAVSAGPVSTGTGTNVDSLCAREGECELGTLAIGKTVSGTDFGDRMGAW